MRFDLVVIGGKSESMARFYYFEQGVGNRGLPYFIYLFTYEKIGQIYS